MLASHPSHCIRHFLYQLLHQITPHIKATFPLAQIPHVQVTLALSCTVFVHFLLTKVVFYFSHLICFVLYTLRWALIPSYASNRVQGL